MDRSSSILCTVEQRKLPSSPSTSKRRSCYHNNNNIGGTGTGTGTTNTNMMKKKKKEGPMKVVYISNPVRFKVTASEFRSLVQELTGQDSEDLPTHQLQFNVASSSCTTHHQSLQFINKEEEDKGVSEQIHQATTTTTTTTEDDDVFTPLDNLSDLFFPNSAFLVL